MAVLIESTASARFLSTEARIVAAKIASYARCGAINEAISGTAGDHAHRVPAEMSPQQQIS